MDPFVIAAVVITVVALLGHLLIFRKIFTASRDPVQILRVERTWDGAPARPDEHVTITLIGRSDELVIDVDAPLHGDPAPDAAAGAVDGLWDFEVVELFILGDGDRYTEVELGPHGHHLVLRLEGARQVVERALPLTYRAAADAPRWRGEARLPRALLPPGEALKVNAYAIHGEGDARRYLAMTPLPGPEPDYHRLVGFEVSLEV